MRREIEDQILYLSMCCYYYLSMFWYYSYKEPYSNIGLERVTAFLQIGHSFISPSSKQS